METKIKDKARLFLAIRRRNEIDKSCICSYCGENLESKHKDECIVRTGNLKFPSIKPTITLGDA